MNCMYTDTIVLYIVYYNIYDLQYLHRCVHINHAHKKVVYVYM